MWTYGNLHEPTVTKVHDGGPFWTARQLLQMDLPNDLNCEENGFLIRNSEIILLNGYETKYLSFLTQTCNAIVKCKSSGAAMKCLNSIELFLSEFLSLDAFSACLYDLVLTHCDYQRNIFMNELGNHSGNARSSKKVVQQLAFLGLEMFQGMKFFSRD